MQHHERAHCIIHSGVEEALLKSLPCAIAAHITPSLHVEIELKVQMWHEREVQKER